MRHRRVREVMTSDAVSVAEDAAFKDIVRVMTERRISGLPVVDAEGVVVGVVSQIDLLHMAAQSRSRGGWRLSPSRRRVGAADPVAADLMTKPALTVEARAPLAEAIHLVVRHEIERLPVVDEAGRLVGIVSAGDLLRVYMRPDADLAAEIVHEVFEHALGVVVNPTTVRIDVTGGVVRLRGELERRSMIADAVRLVGEVDGVVGVIDELTYTVDDTHGGVPAGGHWPFV